MRVVSLSEREERRKGEEYYEEGQGASLDYEEGRYMASE